MGSYLGVHEQGAQLLTPLRTQPWQLLDVQAAGRIGPELDGETRLFELMAEVAQRMHDHLDLEHSSKHMMEPRQECCRTSAFTVRSEDRW